MVISISIYGYILLYYLSSPFAAGLIPQLKLNQE